MSTQTQEDKFPPKILNIETITPGLTTKEKDSLPITHAHNYSTTIGRELNKDNFLTPPITITSKKSSNPPPALRDAFDENSPRASSVPRSFESKKGRKRSALLGLEGTRESLPDLSIVNPGEALVPIRRRYARLGRTHNKEMDVLAAIPEGRDSKLGGSDDSSVEISSGVASRLNGPRRTKGEGKKGQVGENGPRREGKKGQVEFDQTLGGGFLHSSRQWTH